MDAHCATAAELTPEANLATAATVSVSLQPEMTSSARSRGQKRGGGGGGGGVNPFCVSGRNAKRSSTTSLPVSQQPHAPWLVNTTSNDELGTGVRRSSSLLLVTRLYKSLKKTPDKFKKSLSSGSVSPAYNSGNGVTSDCFNTSNDSVLTCTADFSHQMVNGGAAGNGGGVLCLDSQPSATSAVAQQQSSSSSSLTNSSTTYNNVDSTENSSNNQQPSMANSLNDSHQQSRVNGSEHRCIKAPEKELQCSPSKTVKVRKGRFHKLFPDIAETDPVIKSYHCAYVGDILLQGFLYVTDNWFCFYSKLLGKKRIKIAVASVVSITKKKTAIIIPNAVGIYTDTNQYVFGSLMSRDNTYRILCEIWQQKRLGLEKSSLVDVDGSLESAIDMDSIANKSLNTVSSLSSSEDFVASSSSEDNFLSDIAGSSDMINAAESSSLSEVCQVISSPDSGYSVGLTTLTQDYDDVVTRRTGPRSAAAAAPKPFYFNLRCFAAPFGKLYHGVRLKNYSASLCSVVTWLTNLPRTSMFLLVSTVLVFFLLLSAGVLTYRLLNLQAQLDRATLRGWPVADSEQTYDEPFASEAAQRTTTNRRTSSVHQMHQVLEAHIRLLDQVNEALKGLYTWVLKSSASQSTFDGHPETSAVNDGDAIVEDEAEL